MTCDRCHNTFDSPHPHNLGPDQYLCENCQREVTSIRSGELCIGPLMPADDADPDAPVLTLDACESCDYRGLELPHPTGKRR